MNNNIVGIVLAAGFGTLDNRRAKVIETLDANGRIPIIKPVVELVTRLCGETAIVVNHKYGGEVIDELSSFDLDVIYQVERSGTAGAVRACLPMWEERLRATEPLHALILYGDMPFWDVTSISSLMEAHLSSGAVMSMFSVALDSNGSDCPDMVKNFGRILWDKNGNILGIKEPYEMTPEDLNSTTHVNPSAWVINLKWFKEVYHRLSPHSKNDGFSHEYWLPDLVPLAHNDKHTITVLPLHNKSEAVGVNTYYELSAARSLFSEIQEQNSRILPYVPFDAQKYLGEGCFLRSGSILPRLTEVKIAEVQFKLYLDGYPRILGLEVWEDILNNNDIPLDPGFALGLLQEPSRPTLKLLERRGVTSISFFGQLIDGPLLGHPSVMVLQLHDAKWNFSPIPICLLWDRRDFAAVLEH